MPSQAQSNYKLSIHEICHNLPKVELHCHLFGTIRRDTFEYLNSREGSPFTDEEINGFYTRGKKPIGVLRVLRALDSQLIKYPQDLYRITKEYLQFARSHNIIYSEFFWNPTGTAHESHIPFEQAQDAIIRAIDDMIPEGITGRLICSVDREVDPKYAVEFVNWMIKYPNPKTIGIVWYAME
ncbi:unnamed protein product [Ambrosiozyma monospora]|uniref:Unnamed protein product n=1 Tax=Ambrosiozyma monospora TaxID=43982 RepID=A0ACB5TXA6_AMBMO|nr:unnamed protein product [Ambrosiozyma monospora]